MQKELNIIHQRNNAERGIEMIHIALCEDNKEDLKNLRSMLYQTKISSEITEYTSAETLLFDMETVQKQFDLFFWTFICPD